jgi:hypothetical protein
MPALSGLLDSQPAVAATEAWRWWTGELRAMMPERFRSDPARLPRADIKPARDAVRVEIVRDGVGQLFAEAKPLEELDEDGWAELKLLIEGSRPRIILESSDVFVTNLVLPKAARGRLKQAVRLQLSQVAPIEPDLLRWAMDVRDSGQERIEIVAAMARSERIDQLQALFDGQGIDPPPVCVATPDGVIELARGSRTSGGIGRIGARPWAIAALLIASIPFTTALGATILRASAESRIELLEKGARPRLRSEAQARQSEALRRDLRPLVTRPSMSMTLEEIASRLPMTDHVKSARQGGDRILQFTIDTPDAEAAEAALKGSRILPHVAVTDIAPAGSGRLAVTFRTSPR